MHPGLGHIYKNVLAQVRNLSFLYFHCPIWAHSSSLLHVEKRNSKQISQKNSNIGPNPNVIKTNRETVAKSGVNHLNNLLKHWGLSVRNGEADDTQCHQKLACAQSVSSHTNYSRENYSYA